MDHPFATRRERRETPVKIGDGERPNDKKEVGGVTLT